ncbi:methyltransferase family protein [Salibacterium aidingense]|uniref:methyltransferase family protein n=1 Tax=Salibacterium aidingense TaxID=384933 RepID=UPI003BDE16E3
MKNVSVYSHIKAVLTAPFSVTVIIPFVILYLSKDLNTGWGMGRVSLGAGILLVVPGLYLLITTNKLFAQKGKGTLAPWNPPQRLVVAGPYRFVRNPMISGVLFILAGEAFLFGSIYLLAWFSFFWTMMHVVHLFYEEPGLVKRFGKDYMTYKENVPRWLPRLSPWNNGDEKD